MHRGPAEAGKSADARSSTVTLTTFSNATSSSQNLCAATSAPELLLLNGVTGSLIRQASTPSLIEHLQYSHTVLLSGSADGFLRTHDPRTGLRRDGGGAENVVLAHAGGVSGLQVSGNYVYTIGWTHRCILSGHIS